MLHLSLPVRSLVGLILLLFIGCDVTLCQTNSFPIGLFVSKSSQLFRRAFHLELDNSNSKSTTFQLNCSDRELSLSSIFDAIRPLSRSRNIFLMAGELNEEVREAVKGFTNSHFIPYVTLSNPTDATFNVENHYMQHYQHLLDNNINNNYNIKSNEFDVDNDGYYSSRSNNNYNDRRGYNFNSRIQNNNRYNSNNNRKQNNTYNNYNSKNNPNNNNPNNSDEGKYILYMRPMYERPLVDLVLKYNWSSIYYVYDSSEGLFRLDQLYKITSLTLNITLSIEPLKLNNVHNCVMQLRELDNHGKVGENKYIVLDMSTQQALEAVLKQVQAVGMNRAGYHYLLGGMLMDELDIQDFRHGGVNITGFVLLNRNDTTFKYRQREWEKATGDVKPLKLEAALAMDTVAVIYDAFGKSFQNNRDTFKEFFRRKHEYKQQITALSTSPSVHPWHMNSLMMNELKKVRINGLSGPISFDENGLRTDYSFSVRELKLNTDLEELGTWSYKKGLVMRGSDKKGEETRVVVMNRTRIVTTIISSPFLFAIKKKEDEAITTVSPAGKLDPTGLEEYQGYCADLTMKLAEIVNFKFLVKIAPDKKYGEKTDNGTWNGMVGQLTTKKADVAIAPLTITSIRERVIDFTKPFMNLGISIMIKKPEKQKPGVFSFMDPLALNIWACIVISYLAVSFVLFLVSRFSPYEWQAEDGKDSSSGVVLESHNNHNNTADNLYLYYNNNNNNGNDNKATIPREDPSHVSISPGYTNDFTVLNSLWFSLAAFMRQGTDISPRSLSGRVVGSAWWFFTLIIISSYTANLAAFLTVERMLTPIENADDLSKHRDILYGTLLAGSTKEFFRNSKITTYERMWDFMNSNPDVFVETTEDGVNRVRNSKGKYAFLLESTMNDYHNQKKPCNTMKVGNDLDSKGYGVATPIGSDLREPIGLAILQLLEKDYLAKLHKKWWFDKGECVSEDSKGGSSNQSALTLSNVAGIFYILIGGLGLSMVTSLLEFIYKSKSEISKHKKTFAAEVCKMGGDCENGGFTKRDHLLSPLSPHQPPTYQQLVAAQQDEEGNGLPPSSEEFVLTHRANRSAIVLV